MTAAQVPPTPDTKDWTWVLARPCPDCGFAAEEVDRTHIGELLRLDAAAWTTDLADPRARGPRPWTAPWMRPWMMGA
ncbi:hypothetical protein JK386_09130 [Nocardioides sp. zg-536]|uniref:Uncharacterized protein n=1 Tax=Nocardioides faecalis TaxID=2803858 RepID=A0A938Y1A3_9ACTN|nr:hypothetical protein [Nocardioides faecalis]MBM9460066.1 hypothetical protein [Nocardioides faecalis]QVI60134.1 hypothetical protein KG111_07485 [Nocardioides faecalis]